MKIATTLFLFVVVGCTWREAISTCVLESDFGFALNCAFKKSGLFRVRNLGGVKGYVGLGFTVGDELGFRESLSNLESSKRRSVNNARVGNLVPYNAANTDVGSSSKNSRQIPPFKPLPAGASRPVAPQPERQKLVVQVANTTATALKTIPSPSLGNVQAATIMQQQQQQMQQQQQEAKAKQRYRQQQEALAAQMLKQQRLQQQEAMKQQFIQKVAQQQKQQQQQQQQQVQLQQLQLQQQQQQLAAMQTKRMQVAQMLASPMKLPNIVAAVPPPGSVVESASQSQPAALPPFIAMPASTVQLTDRISDSPSLLDDVDVSKNDVQQSTLPGNKAVSSVNQMTLLSLQPISAAELNQQLPLQQNDKRQSLPSLTVQSMAPSLKALAEASNITLEALEAAILLRQQQLMQKHQERTTTTAPVTSTTQSTHKNKLSAGLTKVMNAPREYYPMGYDKNFDDNFASRVDLPDTSFYCGDQKHFPGLYADEDLGCMVFHVCALTDDGLIMKSFLCPESTLFDQTILKCNWWFYVDCKSSKSLYDSNIPISKSYQLMKALAFFSAYKNNDNGTVTEKEAQ